MTTLKRIAPLSAFKIGLIIYAFLGLILGAFCSIVALSGSRLHLTQFDIPPSFGILAIFVCPVVYGLMGGIGAAIAAFFYNVASGWVGGIEVELSERLSREPQAVP